MTQFLMLLHVCAVRFSRLRLKCDGTRAETRFPLSTKRTSPFKSAGASVQSTTGSRGVRISGSNVGYTMFRGLWRVLATHSIRQFPLHFPSRASPCALTFRLDSSYSIAAGCGHAEQPTARRFSSALLAFLNSCPLICLCSSRNRIG